MSFELTDIPRGELERSVVERGQHLPKAPAGYNGSCDLFGPPGHNELPVCSGRCTNGNP